MTKKFIYHYLYVFLLFLIYASLIKTNASKLHLVPNLVFLSLIILVSESSLTETLWFSFFAGFLFEFLSGYFFGAYIFTFLVNGLIIYFVTRKLTAQELGIIPATLLVVILSFIFGFWIYLYQNFFAFLGLSGKVFLSDFYSAKIIWTIILNLLIFYPLRFTFRYLPKA